MRIITRLEITGPANQAILLAARMDSAGYETILVAGEGANARNDDLVELAQTYGVKPRLVPMMARNYNLLGHIRAFWALYWLMRDLQPDIVHTHLTTAGFLGRLAARLAKVPVVVHTLHVHPFQGYYNRISTLMFIWLERIGARLSDAIITLSTSLRRELTEHYHIAPRQRVTVLPLGFDLERFASVPRHKGDFRRRNDIPEDVPLVGIVGRLLPVKNHSLFLDAASRVRREIPDVHFVIIGDGPQRDSIERRAAALDLDGCVYLTGWQSDMTSVYSDLNVLVNSSLNEGTPVPVIEALASGCPVVATAVGGIPDLLDHGELGALTLPQIHPLAEAIVRVLRRPPDPEQARQVMLNRYGIERLVNDLDSLYRGLLANRKRS